MRTPNFHSILFVCLGNICRSPLAEGIAREINNKYNLGLKIDSAGTSRWHIDEPPCEGSCSVAKKHGFSIDDLRGRQISVYGDVEFDMIVALDSQNHRDILRLGFDSAKVHKLGEFGLDNKDVPDPYGFKDEEGFEMVYTMIKAGVENLLGKSL